jgi:hypothetical protein
MNSPITTVLTCVLFATLSGACSSSTAGDSPGAVPQAPMLQSIMPMAGGLHVTWMKHSDCDTVEGERKSGTEDFKVVFTESCASDNKHDATATGNTDYTYRLRAKNKTGYSSYSEEVTANPSK